MLVLLSSCAGGKADRAESLDAQQATATLPDARALPEWDVRIEPVAHPWKKAQELGIGRCLQGPNECSKIQVAGVSAFHGRGPKIDFMLLAYTDSATAESAYEPVWKAWREWSTKPRDLALGDIREESDGLTTVGNSWKEESKLLIAQVRVGSVIMLTFGEAESGVTMGKTLKQSAAVFAERAEQAQDGQTPSAALDDFA
ncbi:hypothetical protein ACH5AI_26775 [Streptomyces collinus]|uniref:hypothetical protein n=1 Tax=Streptomyces collinus TaxID=42684 RepID=UPI0037AC6D7A